MKTYKLFIFLILVSIIMIGCQKSEMNYSIQIKGSDTMVNLGQTWAEAFVNKNPDAMIAVTGGGSGTGIAALINGTADIAEASRKMKDKEMSKAKLNGYNPKEFIVALDALAIVVNPHNVVNKLTFDQLADIFTGRITNWKDVGGEDQSIVLLSREVNSGTHIYFKEHVLRRKGNAEFSPSALLMPSSQAIADEVAQNSNSIGYYGMGYITSRQKAILVAENINDSYVSPTIDNVKNGTYPISRPLMMYTTDEPGGLIKEFINFVLSEDGQKLVREIEFVPIR